MERYEYSLMSLLLLGGTLPIWGYLCAVVPQSPGFGSGVIRYVVAPLVLVGTTAAIHRLLRRCRDGWAWSALLAAIIALSSLHVARWMSR